MTKHSGTHPAQAIRRVEDLVATGLIAADKASALEAVTARYALTITPQMTALMDPNDPQDPIARQFVPSLAELQTTPDELTDPIGDEVHSPVEGIVHRYPDRVLLKLLHACPVYCRFCFRREVVGPGGPQILSSPALGAALDYIRSHADIWEVILTGGDPLALAPRRLGEVLAALSEIPHVKVVRLHSRVPVVDPSRINGDMLAALACFKGAVWVALHANHPRELSGAATGAIANLVQAGIAMVSQTVLLAGVNDDVDTLAALMRAFVAHRIKPYYLHHPDLAPGTSHFRVSLARGRALAAALQGTVSGLCQPTYVIDIPGGHGKAWAAAAQTQETAAGWDIRDFRGQSHAYADSFVTRDTGKPL